MFLQLGKYKFDGIKLPQSWSGNKETKYSEIPIIDSKPIIQMTGESLEELEIEISLSSEFCNPQKEIEELDLSRSNGEILQLVDGSGKNYGSYVIKSISKANESCYKDGTPSRIYVSISLLEYNGQTLKEAKGIAIKSNNPTAQLPAPQGIALTPQVVNKIKEGNQYASFSIPQNPSQGFLKKVKSLTDKAWSSFGDAITLIQKSEKLVKKTTSLVTNLKKAQQSALTLGNYASTGQIVKLAGAKSSLESDIIAIRRNSAILAAIIGSREGV